MSLYSVFWLALGATLVLLGVDLYTGLSGRRGAHLVCVGLTVAGLALSIVLAVRLGSDVVFDPTIQLVHRALARGVVALLAPIAASGAVILVRGSRAARSFHRRVAFFMVAVAVAALGTGLWMKSTGRPEADVTGAPPSAVSR